MNLIPGESIGPYKLLEKIGEGSVGVIFRAEQEMPVRRMVAVKFLKPGMETRQMVARFEAERQALALMDHLNIVRMLDGGTHDAQPYFVMELISGMPITEYCDRHSLALRQRLILFVQLCQAVQHAHQKGIIHRNVNPSDVLVTKDGSTPVVKLIDFGIAKAMGLPVTERTVIFTGPWPILGRPMYISPEQAVGVDVDARTDIYSLGALLYELVTGTTPFDPERFRSASDDDIRRILNEEQPLRPSARCAGAGNKVSPALDAIIMKCLEMDRGRRYESVQELNAAIEEELHPGGLKQVARGLRRIFGR